MPKPLTDTYDYGECDVCGTPRQAHHIKQDLWVEVSCLSSTMSRQESAPHTGAGLSTLK
jgi:hypothetical protein